MTPVGRQPADLEAVHQAVLGLHHPELQQMVSEDLLLDGKTEAESWTDVEVCAFCWKLVYPDGSCDDEYVDPDVFWPCATARALGTSEAIGAGRPGTSVFIAPIRPTKLRWWHELFRRRRLPRGFQNVGFVMDSTDGSPRAALNDEGATE